MWRSCQASKMKNSGGGQTREVRARYGLGRLSAQAREICRADPIGHNLSPTTSLAEISNVCPPWITNPPSPTHLDQYTDQLIHRQWTLQVHPGELLPSEGHPSRLHTLLQLHHFGRSPKPLTDDRANNPVKYGSVQQCLRRTAKGDHRAKADFRGGVTLLE